MLRYAVLALVLGACEASAWVPPWEGAPGPAYGAAPIGWPAGATRGRFGRGEPPSAMASLPIAYRGPGSPPAGALQSVTPWAVPGDGPPRAVLYGMDGAASAIDLVDVNAGAVTAARQTECKGPIVGVTAEAIVCADANGVTALKVGGGLAWKQHVTYLGMTEDRILAVDETDGIVVLDAADGDAIGKVVLPAGVSADELHSTCGTTGRELFAARRDNTLSRIADGKGGLAVAWSAPIGELVSLDACRGDSVLAVVREDGREALVAFDRATGTSLGRIDDLRGLWPARTGDGIEVATGGGLVRAPRDLATRETISPLVLGALIAERGDARLVRVSPATAVLLDGQGVRAYVAFRWSGAVLGDDSIIAAQWTGSAAHTVARLALPPRETRPLRLAPTRAPVIVPVELRDLPAAGEPAAVIAGGALAPHDVVAIAASASEPSTIFAVTLAAAPSDATSAGVAGIDLEARAVWHRADGCGPGTPVGLAAARSVVVCAAQDSRGATVRASELDGEPLWDWTGAATDGVDAAGDAVIVRAGAQARVLDAATGRVRGVLQSDDGGPAHAVAVEVAGLPGTPAGTLVITVERGRLVARVPAASMLPVWALAVDGSVTALAPLPGAVLVALDDGDAFRVDAATAAVTPVAGIGLGWTTLGDLVAGTAAGGPIPGDPATAVIAPPPAAAPAPRRRGRKPPPPPPDAVDRPAMATPRPLPAPLGDAWHLALYAPTGALRARNEYPVFPPIEAGTVRGPGASPIVVLTGAERREVLLVDPATGNPLRRALLPEDAVPRGLGGTLVNGVPTGFVVVARPLRVVTF